jgi:hypothetical protein
MASRRRLHSDGFSFCGYNRLKSPVLNARAFEEDLPQFLQGVTHVRRVPGGRASFGDIAD